MKDDIRQFFEWLWATHRGCLIGGVLGAFLAVAILLFGFFRTLFVLFFISGGLWLGFQLDNDDNDWLERLRKSKPSEYLHFSGKGGRP